MSYIYHIYKLYITHYSQCKAANASSISSRFRYQWRNGKTNGSRQGRMGRVMCATALSSDYPAWFRPSSKLPPSPPPPLPAEKLLQVPKLSQTHTSHK